MKHIVRGHFFALILTFHLTEITRSEEPFCENKCMSNGTVYSRSCHCDRFCVTLYDDCCADARLFNPELRISGLSRRPDVTCKQFVKNQSTYVITGCNPNWRGPSNVVTYCEQLQYEPIDPVGGAPASNRRTGVTYANNFCAICNNDTYDLTLWHIKISCPSHPNVLLDEDEAFQRITYDHGFKQWGYIVRDSFYGCNLTYHTPRALEREVRRCYSDEVGSCDPSWKNDMMKDLCRSYTDPVYFNGTRFKNFYCAICNRVDQSQIYCAEALNFRTENPSESDEVNPMSFTFLLDVNPSGGNKVGKKSLSLNCRDGEVPDPFAKKCRNVVCGIPGYVMRDGKCALESQTK